ncbi:MAG: glycerophosphodiester phosphodiesterase family protein [Gemmatimonadetes bacterium]|nr:glycerophosphodiester phosphodiesterase family protein [Gemmatimonadota bacterium]
MTSSGTQPLADDLPIATLVDPDHRVVIAHRGASADRPENTMGAFELALDHGADALEMDVQVSADGVPFIVHDRSTGRTADVDVPVEASTAAVLREIDAGHRFTVDGGHTHPWRGRGVLLPTLSRVLERFAAVPILLELKSPRGQAEVRRVLDRHAAQRHVVVASTLHGALRVFRDGVYRRAASRREIAWWYLLSLTGLSPGGRGYAMLSMPQRKGNLELVAPRRLALAAESGIPVHVWTVDEPDTAKRLWRDGVTGIITDVPAVMVPLRPSPGAGPT